LEAELNRAMAEYQANGGEPAGRSTLIAEWERVRAAMRAEIGDEAFNSWLKPLVLAACNEVQVTIEAPTRFMRDWVMTHYADRLRDLWRVERPGLREVSIQARTSGQMRRTDAAAAPAPVGASAVPARPVAAEPRLSDDADFGAPLDGRFTFYTFIVGRSNELAHAAARRVAEADNVPFNPLFLYGGVGLGKTHLMHAIAWHIRQKHPNRKVIYLSAEKFMFQFVRAVRFKDTMAFKQQFRSVDVLMIDDVQFIAGKEQTQEEFFHTFNALCDQNRQIIISGDRSPTDLEGIEERMRSRLGWGLVADIHPTDFELRLSILQSKAERARAKNISGKVLEFLAHRISSNIRELEGALNRLLAYSNLIGRPITLEMSQEVLRDLLRANDRKVTIEEIQKRVAEHYNIRLSDMSSARRARAVARPRQVAMFLAKQLTSRSLPEIGRRFGGRDHTTVMHAVRKIEELRAADSSFAEDVDLLRRMLEG
jgi:chromosomal replication initiator protein